MMASARRRSRPGWRSRFRKRGSTSISPRCVFGETVINHTSAIGPKIFQLFAPVTKKLLDTQEHTRLVCWFRRLAEIDVRSQRSPRWLQLEQERAALRV